MMRQQKEQIRFFIFGYGSLIWKPGFSYTSRTVGYIEGFALRFWQGNCTHRGTPAAPGRVATLSPDEKAITWGVAYEVCGASQALRAFDHLNMRECTLGGYDTNFVDFHASDKKQLTSSVRVIVYIATDDNPLYMGPASIQQMALEISNAEGRCGHNVEYLLKLTRFFHEQCLHDQHLFDLEGEVLRVMKKRGVEIDSLMNHSECNSLHNVPELENPGSPGPIRHRRDTNELEHDIHLAEDSLRESAQMSDDEDCLNESELDEISDNVPVFRDSIKISV